MVHRLDEPEGEANHLHTVILKRAYNLFKFAYALRKYVKDIGKHGKYHTADVS